MLPETFLFLRKYSITDIIFLLRRRRLLFQENAMLAGQPPGTVIKCITAQVIQTQQGPRIVLQGLTGSNFTSQQLATIQQQVKQQLLKGMMTYRVCLC